MPKGYVYILECSDGSYYTGSTVNIDKRINQHNEGLGSNHTKKRLPIKLVYFEEFQRIDDAFYREKQIQGWSRKKKEALIDNISNRLPDLSIAYRDKVASSASATRKASASATRKPNKTLQTHQNTSNTNKKLRPPSVAEALEATRKPDETLQTQQNTSNTNKKHRPPSVAEALEATRKPNKTLQTKPNTSNTDKIHRPLSVAEALEATKPKTYRSNGKLLITGEYAVLDGAKALALPTKYGQSLKVKFNDFNTVIWKSYNELNEIWYEDEFLFKDNEILKQVQNDNSVSDRLIQILEAARVLNPSFLNSNQGFNITTQQDFNRLWGLGTSSTLINNIANWANIDAYELLKKTFGGSGYDIACAQYNSPITFQLKSDKKPIVNPVEFNPSFKNKLYFVYLNQKQNSRDGISAYKKLGKIKNSILNDINNITDAIIKANTLTEFNSLIDSHEIIISKLIEQEPIKSRLFNDFDGSVKSLGAWGGDFVLVASETNPESYFNSKGFDVVIPYSDMVLD